MHEPTIQTRAVEFRAVNDDRTIEGIAVPWDETITVWGVRERFERGSIQDSEGAHLFWRHDEPIGRLVAASDAELGWQIRARFSTTQRAEEAHTLAKDGTIDRFSVGFEPLEWRVETDDIGEVIVYTRVRVREVSLVPHPAYASAVVTSVRHQHPATPPAPPTETEHPRMTDTLTRADLDAALTEQGELLERKLSTALADLNNTAPERDLLPFRSMGEWVKATADVKHPDHERALEFAQRAYVGGTTANSIVENAWVSDAIRLVDSRRTVMNAFTRRPLPAEGMAVEFAQVNGNTITADVQATEGADLPVGLVDIDSATAPVVTIGGAARLTRQEIERSSVNMVDTTFRALAISYAKRGETRFREFLAAAISSQRTAGNSVTLAVTPDHFDWLDLIVDAAEAMDDRAHTLGGLYVSKDVFKSLLRLESAGGDPLMNVQGTGVNQVGTIDAPNLSGNLARVPVWLLPGAAAQTATFFDPIAITTFESAGAPFQLQDDNVINLSREFSVYGYQAIALQFPEALLPVEFATV